MKWRIGHYLLSSVFKFLISFSRKNRERCSSDRSDSWIHLNTRQYFTDKDIGTLCIQDSRVFKPKNVLAQKKSNSVKSLSFKKGKWPHEANTRKTDRSVRIKEIYMLLKWEVYKEIAVFYISWNFIPTVPAMVFWTSFFYGISVCTNIALIPFSWDTYFFLPEIQLKQVQFDLSVLRNPTVRPQQFCSLLIILSSQFLRLLFALFASSQEMTKADHGVSSGPQQHTLQ